MRAEARTKGLIVGKHSFKNSVLEQKHLPTVPFVHIIQTLEYLHSTTITFTLWDDLLYLNRRGCDKKLSFYPTTVHHPLTIDIAIDSKNSALSTD